MFLYRRPPPVPSLLFCPSVGALEPSDGLGDVGPDDGADPEGGMTSGCGPSGISIQLRLEGEPSGCPLVDGSAGGVWTGNEVCPLRGS